MLAILIILFLFCLLHNFIQFVFQYNIFCDLQSKEPGKCRQHMKNVSIFYLKCLDAGLNETRCAKMARERERTYSGTKLISHSLTNSLLLLVSLSFEIQSCISYI